MSVESQRKRRHRSQARKWLPSNEVLFNISIGGMYFRRALTADSTTAAGTSDGCLRCAKARLSLSQFLADCGDVQRATEEALACIEELGRGFPMMEVLAENVATQVIEKDDNEVKTLVQRHGAGVPAGVVSKAAEEIRTRRDEIPFFRPPMVPRRKFSPSLKRKLEALDPNSLLILSLIPELAWLLYGSALLRVVQQVGLGDLSDAEDLERLERAVLMCQASALLAELGPSHSLSVMIDRERLRVFRPRMEANTWEEKAGPLVAAFVPEEMRKVCKGWRRLALGFMWSRLNIRRPLSPIHSFAPSCACGLKMHLNLLPEKGQWWTCPQGLGKGCGQSCEFEPRYNPSSAELFDPYAYKASVTQRQTSDPSSLPLRPVSDLYGGASSLRPPGEKEVAWVRGRAELGFMEEVREFQEENPGEAMNLLSYMSSQSADAEGLPLWGSSREPSRHSLLGRGGRSGRLSSSRGGRRGRRGDSREGDVRLSRPSFWSPSRQSDRSTALGSRPVTMGRASTLPSAPGRDLRPDTTAGRRGGGSSKSLLESQFKQAQRAARPRGGVSLPRIIW